MICRICVSQRVVVVVESRRRVVRVRGRERAKTYATVGTVSAAALLGGLVDLDVLDDQGTGVEALGVGVGLGVLQEVQKVLGRLEGPPGLGDTKLLACRAEHLSALVPIPIHNRPPPINFLAVFRAQK